MIYLIMPGKNSQQLSAMVDVAVKGIDTTIVKNAIDIPDLKNKKILFAVELNDIGYNIGLLEILNTISKRGNKALQGSTAGLLIHSDNELYTKSVAKSIIFAANQLGCNFLGHPLVEATGSLNNFLTWQKSYSMSLEEISLMRSKLLCERLSNYSFEPIKHPKVIALHSSSKTTSNTLMLWHMIKEHLKDCDLEELHVENGTVLDCIGCPYNTCKHLGMRNSCYYGGMMVKEILPAIEKADVIVWVCPNYNDSISANLMAVINRLTALYRKIKFYDKTIFSVIVSGNSGSDAVAQQLISALNVNKGFRLPPYFSIMETANDPAVILSVDSIEKKASAFADNIMSSIKPSSSNTY
ncbi:NADPH-dependent FMN reductase [Natronincola peptidivorans]|uniref:NADPH-dependent FMN reductase n=1 Tax=Natronincola peptidivorans TaxID=426128 RepID=A0A1I0EYY2_9FIRM|nr:NAD(P)H-dependent oxidoreductase [Natronincola peptidivorans]SET50348.1 NADPH-dependent FMN reductase [Natronincola peptidivorans]